MPSRNHLRRLPRECYQGDAIVHWTITILDRKQGWLDAPFYSRFRELLTHTAFRYGLVCPMFCLMPDHIHMIWFGLFDACDQLNAMKHFRPRCNDSLEKLDFALQDQAFDHVLTEEERRDERFRNICEYIARNPERRQLVEPDYFANYPYTGCLIPGYPELLPFDQNYWDRFDRIVSRLRQHGLQQLISQDYP